MTPLPILFTGIVGGLFGGALGLIGLTNDAPIVALVGWGVSVVAGFALFVGLVSWSVQIGVRSARR